MALNSKEIWEAQGHLQADNHPEPVFLKDL